MEVWLDDALEDQYLVAYPILKKYGIKPCIAVPTGLIGGGHLSVSKVLRKCMTLEQLKELVKEGCTIASHSVTHPQYEYGKGFADLTLEETEREAKESKEWIIKNLGVEPKIFVVPEHNLRTIQKVIILKYYKTIRGPFPDISIHALTENPKGAEVIDAEWFEKLIKRALEEC